MMMASSIVYFSNNNVGFLSRVIDVLISAF